MIWKRRPWPKPTSPGLLNSVRPVAIALQCKDGRRVLAGRAAAAVCPSRRLGDPRLSLFGVLVNVCTTSHRKKAALLLKTG